MKFLLLLIIAVFSINTSFAQIEFEQPSSVSQNVFVDSLLIDDPILSKKIIEDSKHLLEKINQNSTSINEKEVSDLLKDYKVKYIITHRDVSTVYEYGKTIKTYNVEKYENKNPIINTNAGIFQLTQTHEKDYITINRTVMDVGNTYSRFSQECWILEKIL